jgi:Penicillin-insensitive murein endopeptidase
LWVRAVAPLRSLKVRLLAALAGATVLAACGAAGPERTGEHGMAQMPRERTPAPLAPGPVTGDDRRVPRHARVAPRYPERGSVPLGLPSAGRLVRGVQLPAYGPDHVTWDPILERVPNRGWRRYGTDRLVRLVLEVAEDHRRAHPGARRLLIGDLSRRRGGDFGAEVSGGIGHASHQNGLDVDIYYPRDDRRRRAPTRPDQVDRRLAQDLVDRFVEAGAQLVFVGPSLGLSGPSGVVQPLAGHDDHLHVRLAP